MSVLPLISGSHYCLDMVKEKLTSDTSHSFSSFRVQLVMTRINTLTLYSLSKKKNRLFLHSERKVCLISAFALISSARNPDPRWSGGCSLPRIPPHTVSLSHASLQGFCHRGTKPILPHMFSLFFI